MRKRNEVIVYKNLEDIVEREHSCLVVWDVQNGLVNRIFNREEFLSNLKKFIDILRGRMPIIYTLITPMRRDFMSSWGLFSMMRRFNVDEVSKLPPFMVIGSQERDIPEIVRPGDTDVILEKSTASIFIGTNFEYMLRNRNISTVIFTGIATEMGIESSARDASNRGFYPVIVSNCVSSFDKDAHERSLKAMNKLFIVETSDNIMMAIDKKQTIH